MSVALSDVALANGATGEVRAKAAKTKSDQQKEAEMISAMLRGEDMPEEEASPVAAAPGAPAARPTAAATRAAATSRKREAPTPAQTADPRAGHTMNNE